jgi:hypothetical protein
LHDLPDEARSPQVESERLARHWFGLVRAGSLEQLAELVHEDVVVVSKVQPGLTLRGRDAVAEFVTQTLTDRLHEVVTDVYRPLDEDRVVVEGRLRWIDEEHVIRDDPVTWALEFRDGLLLRFLPARTPVEAETLLRSAPD